jgi:hypothetical protein
MEVSGHLYSYTTLPGGKAPGIHYVTNSNQLIVFTEIAAVHSEHRTRHINTLRSEHNLLMLKQVTNACYHSVQNFLSAV